MELLSKLEILADAAKYDVSCSSSGSNRKNVGKGLGNGHMAGICHSWSDDGRCISLLKILLTNECIYNCVYCVNRSSNDIPRASFTPEEVAELTINFYRRNYIEGLFLSAAVFKSPDYTMELMVKTAKLLRQEYRFNGYIHMKAIPGADISLIHEAGQLVDRMSVNIELPSNEGLKLLAPQKKKEAIIKPMGFISSQITEKVEERKLYRKAGNFVPAGQSTQLIVGATSDADLNILRLSEGLYNRFGLKRVYYSAYVPVSSDPKLPVIANPPLLREHRLYQADWLLRFYGFSSKELLQEDQPNFDVFLDPKCNWALRNLHLFPLEINRAPYEMLLRIPGIGVKSANRIAAARRFHSLSYDSLKKIGVVLKRAKFFITCNGRYYGEIGFKENLLRQSLIGELPKISNQKRDEGQQLSMFSLLPEVVKPQEILTTVTGEF
ncbi:putative DNA modification/repair radical SAM protein [Anaerovirgula multivorans]|uniref:Putative DNA modification/repair radical SAM protein n=1 Tax=Anaerovirgula multivorans TaxID=312168 RepID=A0A239G303_9FIRM|nr:putative DNA modification/repair radical SAM protein [Anaerovirgula multivorans]SNS63365.1 putative DNA modification/repair radical SAM protein [Anaerovirgula multivorans]